MTANLHDISPLKAYNNAYYIVKAELVCAKKAHSNQLPEQFGFSCTDHLDGLLALKCMFERSKVFQF